MITFDFEDLAQQADQTVLRGADEVFLHMVIPASEKKARQKAEVVDTVLGNTAPIIGTATQRLLSMSALSSKLCCMWPVFLQMRTKRESSNGGCCWTRYPS